MVLLLISGYKPHLALLGWYNEGEWGLPLRGKCITIHGEREKGGCGAESGCCLFKMGLSDQNFMQGCNWWYSVAL